METRQAALTFEIQMFSLPGPGPLTLAWSPRSLWGRGAPTPQRGGTWRESTDRGRSESPPSRAEQGEEPEEECGDRGGAGRGGSRALPWVGDAALVRCSPPVTSASHTQNTDLTPTGMEPITPCCSHLQGLTYSFNKRLLNLNTEVLEKMNRPVSPALLITVWCPLSACYYSKPQRTCPPPCTAAWTASWGSARP